MHGYGTVDLTEQLETAQLVLGSAGIEAEVQRRSASISGPAASQLVAAVVREAVTNLLRHSEARQVSIHLTRDGRDRHTGDHERRRLDGGRRGARPGAGRVGRAGGQAGARLRTGPVGDRFEVRLELAAR